MNHIFLSYGRKDASEIAQKIYQELEARRIDVWLDIHDINAGGNWRLAIEKGLKNALAVVLLLSPAAVLSKEVQAEWNAALELHIPIIPLLVKDTEIPFAINTLNYIDFRKDIDAGISALRRSISTLPQDHLQFLEYELSRYKDLSKNANDPNTFQDKIKVLKGLVKRWEKLYDEQQARLKSFNDYTILNGGSMVENFVGRKRELEQLRKQLEKTLAGQNQVAFVLGEAGTGKSALIEAFAKEAIEKDEKLLFVSGNCNAQTGISDPYLPFRQILGMLTGDESRVASNAITAQNASRFGDILKTSGRVLLEIAPELVGTLIPGGGLVTAIGRMMAKEKGMLKGLEAHADAVEKRKVEIEQSQIFLQYTAFLRDLSKQHPLVLVLDDLQWIDAASNALLFHLSRELKGSRILLIGLYRPNEVAAGRNGERHPFAESLANIVQSYGEIKIDLDKATQNDGRSFINDYIDSEANTLSAAFREALYKHTAGHALFTVELLRAMQESGDLIKDAEGTWNESPNLNWDELPAKVEAVIEDRIERLAEELREILTTASVEGMDFTAQVVGSIQELREKDLLSHLSQQLEKRHRLIHENGEIKLGNNNFLARFSFSHVLFQRYLYNALGTGQRRRLHADVAEVLEKLYEGKQNEIAIQLARHYREAGDTERAAEYLSKAGQKSLSLGAITEARALLLDAKALMEDETGQKPEELRAEIEYWIGETYRLQTKFLSSKEHYQNSIAFARKNNALEILGKALLSLGISSWQTNEFDIAQKHIDEALIIARKINNKVLECQALRNLGVILGKQEKHEEREKIYHEVYQLATELNDPKQLAQATNSLGALYSALGDYRKAFFYYKEAFDIAEKNHLLHDLALFATNVTVCWRFGDYKSERNYGERCLELGKKLGRVNSQLSGYLALARCELFEGSIDLAIQILEEALPLAREAQRTYNKVSTPLFLVPCYLEVGREADAIKILKEAAEIKSEELLLSDKTVNERWWFAFLKLMENQPLEAKALFLAEHERISNVDTKRLMFQYHLALATMGLAIASVGDEQSAYLAEVLKILQACVNPDHKGTIDEIMLTLKQVKRFDKDNVLQPIEEFLQQMREVQVNE